MTQYKDIILADTPLHYWRLGEVSGTSAIDQKGTSNGTYTGTIALNQTGLLLNDIDKSVSVNGGYVALANENIGTSISYEMIFKRLTGTVSSNLFEYMYNLIRVDSAGISWFYSVGASAVTIPISLALNTRYHLVITQVGTVLNVYLNGVQIITNLTVAGIVNTTFLQSAIGAYNGTSNLDAIVDEVSIYGYVLSPTLVAAHYNSIDNVTSIPSTAPASGGGGGWGSFGYAAAFGGEITPGGDITTDQATTGTARLASITSRTIVGTARLSVTTSKIITGSARLTKIVLKLQIGSARLTATNSRPQIGTARLTRIIDRTIVGNALIQAPQDRPQIGNASLITSGDRVQIGNASILGSSSRPQIGNASLILITSRTITGAARLSVVVARIQIGNARLTAIVNKSQIGNAKLEARQIRIQVGNARLTAIVTRPQTGNARLRVDSIRTQIGNALLWAPPVQHNWNTGVNAYIDTDNPALSSTKMSATAAIVPKVARGTIRRQTSPRGFITPRSPKLR